MQRVRSGIWKRLASAMSRLPGLIEIMQDEVLSEVATKDFVDLACERVKKELGDKITNLVKWIAGIAIVQTASIIFGTVGLIEILK
jgi:hypothetical protein